MVADEGVSRLRLGVRILSGHAAVHIDPQWDMVTPEDRCLNVHHITQEENTGRPLRLPVL